MTLAARWRGAIGLLVGVISCVGLAVMTAPSRGDTTREAMDLPAGAWLGRAVPADREMNLTVDLTPSHASALRALATSVSTPGSAQFRRYWSVARFAGSFGASRAHVVTVSRAMRRLGLRVGPLESNRLTLSISGTVGTIERAFGVSIDRVESRRGTIGMASAMVPALPAGTAGMIQGIDGLEDLDAAAQTAPSQPPRLAPARSGARASAGSRADAAAIRPQVVTGGPQPCSAATAVTSDYTRAGSPETEFTADEIADAYDMDGLYAAGDEGSGQTVALVELSTDDPGDVSTFQACYGTNASVSTVAVGGAVPQEATTAEVALDIDQIVGIAPQANVLVYVGSSPDADISQIVSDDRAQVISSSVTDCDQSTAAALDTLLQEAAIQGQSFFKGAGDNGATQCDQGGTTPSVAVPSEDPFAISTGGSSLYAEGPSGPVAYAPGDTPVQGVWNSGNGSGTGGGVSNLWAMPSYQADAAGSLGVINADSQKVSCGSSSGYCREVPDVSADANPSTGYVVYTQGEWAAVGGDSATGPLWAAFAALANASSACDGHSIGFADPSLYAIAGSDYAANFTDVSQPDPFTNLANNDTYDSTGGLYPTTTGYDMTTGLGTMLATPLAKSLCALRTTVTVANPGPQSGQAGTSLSLAISSQPASGVTFAATGLPAGLTINPGTGVISGTPTAAGSFSVRVSAADADYNSGSTQFTWTITAATTVSTATTSPITPTPTTPTSTRTNPPTRTTPAPTVARVGIGQLTVRGDLLTVVISCGQALTCTVTGSLTVTERHRVKGTAKHPPTVKTTTVNLGTGKLTLAHNRGGDLKIALNAAGQRLLRLHKTLAATLTVHLPGGSTRKFPAHFREPATKRS